MRLHSCDMPKVTRLVLSCITEPWCSNNSYGLYGLLNDTCMYMNRNCPSYMWSPSVWHAQGRIVSLLDNPTLVFLDNSLGCMRTSEWHTHVAYHNCSRGNYDVWIGPLVTIMYHAQSAVSMHVHERGIEVPHNLLGAAEGLLNGTHL